MIAFLTRIFGSVIIGVCVSGFTTLAMALLLTIRNLSGILRGLQHLLRSFLRASFRLYARILNPIRGTVYEFTGVDVVAPLPRTVVTTVLSILLGLVIMLLFSWQIRWRVVAMFAIYGAFVGLAWESILHSDDFQLGVNLE